MKFSHTLSSVLGLVTLVTLSKLSSGVSATAIPAKRADNNGSSPRFVAYWDDFVSGQSGPPDPSTFKGFNVVYVHLPLS